ncbi:MBL fold metallo-hydrolase [Aminipila luticellarii]|uniref:MBL fold metallo-hydrolase n=1 Tax=Aminipila luticellarii TaxID=2507160 RepID=A0A410PVR3_9FIRM|nr:MBL fold metallo-hydrolase [Aminipila luticellarii]QAT43017.1 MBL fold metallo-hydrolase [Aminipila luticellarii]
MNTIFNDFPDHDRFKFPEGLWRVTAGKGGEAILVFGSKKTFLVDCGMAYCGDRVVRNIEFALAMHDRTSLDGILLSHSHYDHIGALPYMKKRWPEAVVYGAAKAKSVFARPGARALMKELGTVARDLYSESKNEILVDGLAVDVVVSEGDEISIGDEYFKVLETKGHTDCSLTYILEPRKIMFASESTGVLENPQFVHTSILKSYKDSIESALKCKAYQPKYIICPHFGILPEYFTDEYFDLYIKSAEYKKDFLLDLHRKGLDKEQILAEYVKYHWSERRAQEQPKEAFTINGGHMIDVILKEFS